MADARQPRGSGCTAACLAVRLGAKGGRRAERTLGSRRGGRPTAQAVFRPLMKVMICGVDPSNSLLSDVFANGAIHRRISVLLSEPYFGESTGASTRCGETRTLVEAPYPLWQTSSPLAHWRPEARPARLPATPASRHMLQCNITSLTRRNLTIFTHPLHTIRQDEATGTRRAGR